MMQPGIHFASFCFVLLLSSPILAKSPKVIGKRPMGAPRIQEPAGAVKVRQGMGYFARRAISADGKRKFSQKPVEATNINSAIIVLREALREAKRGSRQREEAGVLLLKSLHFKAVYTGASNKVQQDLYTEGQKLGVALEKEFPNSSAIRYWLAVQWGKWAEVYGKIAAARQGVADKIKTLAERIIRDDQNYYFAGGYRVLGRLHNKSPRIPFFLSWPSNDTAIDLLTKAQRLAPSNILNNLFLAEALLDSGGKKNREQALALLQRLIQNVKPSQERHIEDTDDLSEARRVYQIYAGK